ncbi:MAG TPA: molybdopterin-dependent oxidoreductase [Ktedonobacteraceae bacterium]|nr:molybdopterin-dependent oxidoreductase [Ktedonobacteraceae bacterium]
MTMHSTQSPLIVHQEQPFNAEPPGDLLRQSFLTPQEHFYVRTHGSIPMVDPTSYRLLLTGLVQRKQELSLDELRSMFPVHTVTATLECAGNRRNELIAVKPIPGEVPWKADVIGTATWRGVPLREVLRAVGVEADARYVAFTSLDEAQFEGEKVSYGSSIALEKALSPDVLLAYEMNDEPLAPEHGFPLRVIVPGYIGARSVKWLREITLQEHPSTNPYQACDYKIFPPEITAKTVDWSRGKTIEDLTLNAVITTPQEGETVAAGPTRIQGYAITGEGVPVERVELSVDGGKTWTTANIGERAGPYAWCFWEVTLALSPGDCQMIVRAWDASRQTQPEDVRPLWNFKGYMNNAWHRVKIHVS